MAIRRTPLFAFIGCMATMSIREFQAQSIANLVWAFAQVHIYCEPLFNVIVAEGARGCAFEMEPQAVANTDRAALDAG